jgi:hypothetical protein
LPTSVSFASSYGVHLPLLPAVQNVAPSLTTQDIGSARNHRSNLDPISGTEFRYRFSQLCVFFWCPFASGRLGDGGVQSFDPSFTTLFIRSTRNQRSNWDPIVTELLYCVSELCIFFRCPVTCVDGGVQTMVPSLMTLGMLSIWDQHCNCSPIAIAVFRYPRSQLCVFFWCPWTVTYVVVWVQLTTLVLLSIWDQLSVFF